MTSFKLIGAAFALSALLATQALAQGAIGEPSAAESLNPNFSIYSSSGDAFASSRAMTTLPFNADVMAQMRAPVKPHRASRASVKHY